MSDHFASHNPFADNGIKFFTGAGVKLTDGEEVEIEAHIAHHDLQSLAGDRFGSAEYLEGAVEGYVWDVVRRIPLDLSGMKIAVDCAHGAMSRAPPLALAESGADVTVLFGERLAPASRRQPFSSTSSRSVRAKS